MCDRFLPTALVALLVACSSPPTVVPIQVMSGRPQPPPSHTAVSVGAAVVLKVEGLATNVVVFAPGDTRVAVGGPEVRFVPQAPGTYRVEQAEAPGTVLALLDVRR